MVQFSTLITSWYRLNSRDLPWRATKNPYYIWLSEIILQQTRVDQGMDYYHKFVQAYPRVQDLAKAPEDEVLKNWQGLGYYSRARNLHTAAKYIVENLKGEFPCDYENIKSLKGVGEYTAAAIASFAFNEVQAVVDGNVYRLLSRYFDIETPIDTTAGKKEFKTLANALIDPKNPAEHNQSIMEMGALVCTPKAPNCGECPLMDGCLAQANNKIDALPVKSKKTKVRNRYFNYLFIAQEGKTVIHKRGPKDVWQGLYDFPLIELESDRMLNQADLDTFGSSNAELSFETKHILSHQRIYAKFWEVKETNFDCFNADYSIIPLKELDDYPMPQLLIRYLQRKQEN